MAFPVDVVVSSDGGTTDHTYSQISVVGGKSIRKDSTLELDVPALLTISHQVTGQGESSVARRMIRVDKTLEESGEYATVSAHMVLTVPNVIVTKADVEAEVNKLVDFITTAGYLDKILNGEP
jgi:hypothetical protein